MNESSTFAASPLGETPLLAVKFRQPQVRASIVPRARLTERLNAGLSRALTLVSAPVGFGKTTLLGEWLAGAAQTVPAACRAFLKSASRGSSESSGLSHK
jgi:hypothetical protein